MGKKVDLSRYVSRGTSTSINAIANDIGEGDGVNVQLDDNKSSPTDNKSSSQGRAILLIVAFLYGTLNVTLRGVYATDGPPVPSVLSFVRQVLSLLAFVPILLASSSSSSSRSKLASKLSFEEEQIISMSLIGDNTEARTDGNIIRPMWKSALELAFWNFGAQGLVTLGLLVSPAARASFLTQTSVVITPLISALAGETIGPSVWSGSGLALLGLFLISTSDTTMTPTTTSSLTFLNRGDVMILLGALSWSMYIYRTSKLAKDYPELVLQFAKTALLAIMYGSWFAFDAVSTLNMAAGANKSEWSMEALTPLWAGWNSSPFVWMLLIYSAVGPGAIADLLQQRGQKLITSASESNVILCLETVFAACCAYAFLGEVSSIREIAGGAMIVFAAILASR